MLLKWRDISDNSNIRNDAFHVNYYLPLALCNRIRNKKYNDSKLLLNWSNFGGNSYLHLAIIRISGANGSYKEQILRSQIN
jgi:hypothetical protein